MTCYCMILSQADKDSIEILNPKSMHLFDKIFWQNYDYVIIILPKCYAKQNNITKLLYINSTKSIELDLIHPTHASV